MTVDARAVLSRTVCAPDVTVRYGEHPDQVADLRRPAPHSGTPKPLVIVVHGGFWRAEWDRTHTGPLAVDLAARGYPVAQLEYRRTGSPGGGWPGTLDDVRAGVAALPGLAARAFPGQVGTAPPLLVGHSAGGQLALYCATEEGIPVGGVLALAPVADLAEAYRLDLDGGAVAALLGGGPTEVPDRYAIADPCRRVPVPCPVAVVHGQLDEQVPPRLSRTWADTARAAGGNVTLLELDGCEHFGVIDPEGPCWIAVVGALGSLHIVS